MSNQISMMWQASPFYVIFAGVVISALVLYFIFIAINNLGLTNEKATATVASKEYRQAGTTYIPQVINGRVQTLPQSTAEQYILKLNVSGERALVGVEKSVYDNTQEGDQLQVEFVKKRITGGLQVVSVN